jgi:diketogulonate reductase-like aldo/keto reductase
MKTPHYSCLTLSNEEEVGKAVANSSTASRAEVFLTTKLGHADKVEERLAESIKKIDPRDHEGYVDLFLIHSPSAGPEKREEQWRAMERLVETSKAKAIGVSN